MQIIHGVHSLFGSARLSSVVKDVCSERRTFGTTQITCHPIIVRHAFQVSGIQGDRGLYDGRRGEECGKDDG
ncbi:hypothetical protein PGTUg99_031858 [Puccinia graminis f. sp. tritici]|uniref:Uncharacterized protein n=1 Tax=Puccinia graminis f. sp. tritici TaxID=56615 RepID=A0A5B0SKI8_PUCGR|nr:hypothetical protein PGTUg99_031858 [Puccinia graminis f. sp. tritici]